MFKLVVLLIFYNFLYAQNFHTYKLFDNKFQTMFPEKPTIKNLSEKYKKFGIKIYQYSDKTNKFVITAQYMPSALEDISKYKQSTKKILDMSIKEPLKLLGHQIMDFSSIFDRKNSIYIAIFTSSYIVENKNIYLSTKQIIYKDKVYKWTMIYTNINTKNIFDKYKEYCKIIK